MTNFLYLIPVAFLMASCGGRNSDSASEAEQQSDTKMVSCEPIEGQWLIEQVVANDSDQLRPVDIDPEAKLYAHFYADSTFNFRPDAMLSVGDICSAVIRSALPI